MAITYRNPNNFHDYLHSLPLCVFKVANSESPAAPYPSLTKDGEVVAGGGFAMWFHETYDKVRTTKMEWDKSRGFFRKQRVIRPYHNVIDTGLLSWEGTDIAWNDFPPEGLGESAWHTDRPYIAWEPDAYSEDYLTTTAPYSTWSRSTIRTYGDHTESAGALFASATVVNSGTTQGPGFFFSLWLATPSAIGDDNYSEVHYNSSNFSVPVCGWCEWEDIPKDSPHIMIELGSIAVYIVLPHRIIDDDGIEPDRSVNGFVRTAWNLRSAGLGKEFEIKRTDLVLMNQKDALKAWPRLDIGITQIGNAFAVIFDESFGETTGKGRRDAEVTSHTHLLEPWSELTNVATTEMGATPPFTIKGNEFSPDGRRVFIPSDQYIALHSRCANYSLGLGQLDYETDCKLEGWIPWDNRRTDLDDWEARSIVIAAFDYEQTSEFPEVPPYTPGASIEFEWDESVAGKKRGRIHWTITPTDQPADFLNLHPWREDWAAAIQGFTTIPDKTWTEAGAQAWEDYGQVIEKVTVTAGEAMGPGITEATITIPLHHLEDHPTLKDTWRTELVNFAPVEIWLGWISNTDTYTPVSDNITADLAPRLMGYIYSVEIIGEGEGIERTVVVRCRDELMRSQKPAAMIDMAWQPLDLLPGLFNPATGVEYGADGRATKGYDAVQWLLQRALGNAYDLTLHPFGRYDYTTGFYANHQEFIGHLPIVRGQAASRSGSMAWPPPYGRDVWSWLEKIAAYDAAMLFWKPLPVTVADGDIKGATDGKWRSRIHYANWQYHIYVDAHSAFTFYPYVEASVGSGTENMLTRNNRIIRASDKRRPQEAINRVVVQAERAGTPWPYQEWTSTDWKTLESPTAGGPRWFGGQVNTKVVSLPAAKALATQGSFDPGWYICRMLGLALFSRSNSQMDVTVPGQPYLWWGDTVNIPDDDPIRDPDTTLAYRVIRFTDEATFKESGLSYTTEVTLSEEPAYFNA